MSLLYLFGRLKSSFPLVSLSLLSCGHAEYTAQECKALAAPQAYFDRCMGGKINGKYVGDLECWPFSPPRRERGILLDEFERSEFYPDATSFEQVAKMKGRIWVDFDLEGPAPPLLQRPATGKTQAFLVEAEGRLSLCGAWFGHLGNYPREFIITRFYSVRDLNT